MNKNIALILLIIVLISIISYIFYPYILKSMLGNVCISPVLIGWNETINQSYKYHNPYYVKLPGCG